MIVRKFPDLFLVLAGGGVNKDLDSLIVNLNLAQRVIRLGMVSNEVVPGVIAGALFGVIPSRDEGFGQVALEFFLSKKCVVASGVGGLLEIVKDGTNGYIVPPDNPEALAKRMAHLVERLELRHQLGENGQRMVLSTYNAFQMGSQYCELLERVSTESRSIL
jgi:glycosyltransferase involved in cell wall biosynthesis